MMILVVTGCLGFIGSQITRTCLEQGHKVYGVDKISYAANSDLLKDFLKNKNFTFECSDICEMRSIPDCDYIINTAAETHVGNSIIDSTEFVRSNILGVQNLLNLIKNKPNNVSPWPVLLHFSTDEVYGDITTGSHTEDSFLNPSNPYSASKASADLLIKSWARTYGVEYIIVRPTNNYGKYQYPEKLIPVSVKQLQRKKRIRLHDRGEPTRVWLHVRDTTDAILKIIKSGSTNQIYNISGGFEQKNIDTVIKIIKAFDKDLEVEDCLNLDFKRKGQDVRYSLNDEKIRRLGWEPKMVFDEEIDEIVNFYKQNFRW